MAIDTRAKRFSMLNFGLPPTLALFEADGTVDADDRAHMLNLYAGIALDAPVAVVASIYRALIRNVVRSISRDIERNVKED